MTVDENTMSRVQSPPKTAQTTDESGDRPIVETTCPIISNDWVNAEYKRLVLKVPVSATCAMPGQFFHLLCPTNASDAPFLRRPMSIYRIDRDRSRLEFLYKIVGKGTRTLAELGTGDDLNVLGPLGKGFDLNSTHRHIIQIGRGVGLATLAQVAETAGAMGTRTTAVLSARSPDLLMSVDYLRGVGAEVITVTDSANTSGVDQVERIVRGLIEHQGGDLLITCGSNRLLTLARRLGSEYGIPGEVALEQTMGCGIGMCFACVREFRSEDGAPTYRRVCWDGPVFDIQEVLSW
jgi:dihydroorotate dehydrogenase electron transfer subunit